MIYVFVILFRETKVWNASEVQTHCQHHHGSWIIKVPVLRLVLLLIVLLGKCWKYIRRIKYLRKNTCIFLIILFIKLKQESTNKISKMKWIYHFEKYKQIKSSICLCVMNLSALNNVEYGFWNHWINIYFTRFYLIHYTICQQYFFKYIIWGFSPNKGVNWALVFADKDIFCLMNVYQVISGYIIRW